MSLSSDDYQDILAKYVRSGAMEKMGATLFFAVQAALAQGLEMQARTERPQQPPVTDQLAYGWNQRGKHVEVNRAGRVNSYGNAAGPPATPVDRFMERKPDVRVGDVFVAQDGVWQDGGR